VATILGGYAAHCPMNTFAGKNNESIPNDLARLKGARMVVATESDHGMKLREATVKRLTGGDKVVARFLHQEFFEFFPTFKIFLVCNHKPKIVGTDRAIWERVHLMPFEYIIPREKQNPELPEQLLAERDAILNWLVAGCEMWATDRVGTCAAVMGATGGYRVEMDTLAIFLDSECDEHPDAQIRSSDLYKLYAAWTKANGEYSTSQTTFSIRLKELGYTSVKGRTGALWTGIAAKATPSMAFHQ
jgi:putative DNA primase/helicase